MQTKSIKILIIDDDKDEYFLIKDLIRDFELFHAHIDWIDNYDKAILAIAKKEHDVYLLDYRLGSHSGIDILSQLSESELLSNSIYVFLTGFGNSSIDKEALENGADDFLSKSELSVQVLERTIRYGLERKRAFIELKKSQSQYKQIYLNTRTPVIEVNLEMDVLKVNKAFNHTFKYDENFVVHPQKNNLKVWDLLDCVKIKEKVLQHIRKKSKQSTEIFECNNQQKEVLLVQMNVYELIGADGEYTYQIVLNDLTEKIKEDKAKYQKEKLDLMEKMARIVAHEVRNPLTNIILSGEQLAPVIPEDKKLYTDIIKRNSHRIEVLIRKFLDTFKSVEITKIPENIQSLLEESIVDIEDKAKLLNVRLTTNITDEIPSIPLDKDKIRLVIVNLLNNAIQACENKEESEIIITATHEHSELHISIADNGTGIPEDDLAHLFEPFFTKKTNGLGLGLTTSLNILKSHSGKIHVENNARGGATFTICLPKDNVNFI